MIVVVDLITRKEAVELGHIEVKIKVLLEYLFELSSKSKTFCKCCNDEDIVADGSPGANTMTCKHSAKRGESGNCKTYRFQGVTLLTIFATRNLMSLTLVVAEVQGGSSTLHGFEVTGVRKKDRGCHLPCVYVRCRKTWKPSLRAHQIEPADLQRGKH